MIRLTTPLIPFINRARQATDRCDDQLERYFDALATQLVGRQTGPAGHNRAIGVTSCTAEEGVSTVARNLATAFAQSRGKSTLLADFSSDDAGATAIGGTGSKAATEPCSDQPLCDRACPTDTENLSVLAADSLPSPLSSIESKQLQSLIDELKETFELIVFDMPHADELSGCFSLASAMDGVLLVVEPEAVSAVDAGRAKERLQHAGANLLGVVVNKEK